MKFLKNNLKAIITFLIGVILSGGIVYAATTNAREVTYTTSKNGEVQTVADALNDLYINMSNGIEQTSGSQLSPDKIVFIGENKGTSITIDEGYQYVIITNMYWSGGGTDCGSASRVANYDNCEILYDKVNAGRNHSNNSSYTRGSRTVFFKINDSSLKTSISFSGSDANFVFGIKE